MTSKYKNKNIINISLRLIKQCPVCSARYTYHKVQILDNSEAGILVYLTCSVCYSSLIATIIEMPFGVIGSAVLTDLQAYEVIKFMESEEITEDDVLKVYQFLEGK